MISKAKEKGENEIEVLFEDISTTFVDPLVEYILKEKGTEVAAYAVEHHLKGPLRMRVRSSEGEPEDLVARAVDKLVADIDKVRSDLEKSE